MPIELQVKLLRVLEEGKFRRVGGNDEINIDARIIAASNRDPQKAIADGKMREDLYYRLNVFPIEVPPLRERLEDIPLFSHFFLQKLNETEEKKVEKIDADFIEALQAYEWPGNVRELRNVINRAFIMARTDTLTRRVPAGQAPRRPPQAPHGNRRARFPSASRWKRSSASSSKRRST